MLPADISSNNGCAKSSLLGCANDHNVMMLIMKALVGTLMMFYVDIKATLCI